MTEPPTHATGGRSRDRIGLALLAFAFTTVMLGTTLPTPIYALYSDEMHFTVLTTTVIFSTYAVGVLVALLVFGRWSDVVGRRPMLLLGAGFALASAVVFLFADDVPVLVVGRLLSGLSAGIFTGTATAAIVESAPADQRDRATAIATVANIGGLGTGPLLAGALVQYAPDPLQLSFVVHIVLVALAIGAVLLTPETSGRTGRLGFQRLSVPVETRPIFVTAATAAFAGFAVTGLFMAVVPTFVKSVIGIDNHFVAGIAASSIFVASAIAQPAARRIPSRQAIAVGCAILIVGMAILALALHFSSLPTLLVAAVVAGVGQGISFSRGLAAVGESVPADRRAEVSSTYFVVAYVAIALPVISEGFASQQLGMRTAGVSFTVVAAVLAALCLVAIIVQERRAPAKS